MAMIPLTKGLNAVIDDQDVDLVAGVPWRAWMGATGLQYAIRTIRGDPDTIELMHRVVAGAPKGWPVDHRNGCGLDNRRENLRIATRAQNSLNSRSVGGISEFKGVTWGSGKWRARISVEGRKVDIGAFDTEIEAAQAYDYAARTLFGEFAKPNFPEFWVIIDRRAIFPAMRRIFISRGA